MIVSKFDEGFMDTGQYFLFQDRVSGFDIVISKKISCYRHGFYFKFVSLTRSNFYSTNIIAFNTKFRRGENHATSVVAISRPLAMEILHKFFQIMAKGRLTASKRYDAIESIDNLLMEESLLAKAIDKSFKDSEITDATFIV